MKAKEIIYYNNDIVPDKEWVEFEDGRKLYDLQVVSIGTKQGTIVSLHDEGALVEFVQSNGVGDIQGYPYEEISF